VAAQLHSPKNRRFRPFSRIFPICEALEAVSGAAISHFGMKTDHAKKPSKNRERLSVREARRFPVAKALMRA
jgi:hypothetical protein